MVAGHGVEAHQALMRLLVCRVSGHQALQQADAGDNFSTFFAHPSEPEEQVDVQLAQPFALRNSPVFIQDFRKEVSAEIGVGPEHINNLFSMKSKERLEGEQLD
jgi:hypothetical protein